jgi:hypothetical protein
MLNKSSKTMNGRVKSFMKKEDKERNPNHGGHRGGGRPGSEIISQNKKFSVCSVV